MKPVRSSVRDDPDNDIAGDCYRACLASILELPREAVPHFYHDDTEPDHMQEARLDAWLAERGLVKVRIALGSPSIPELLEAVTRFNPHCCFILVGEGRVRGVNHAVVIRDGAIVHDPSVGVGVRGPVADASHYQIEFLAPAIIAKPDAEPHVVPAHRPPPTMQRYLLDEDDQLVMP